MMRIERTNSKNKDFAALVKLLDADLAIKDGDDHAFYHQYNKIDKLKFVVMVYEDDQAVGCGAIKEFDPRTMEVKRMFTTPESRGRGIGTTILKELEKWAHELSYKKCILETGKRQPDAIALYLKNGYQVIPNYGQYAEMDNSVCFEKSI